LRNAADDELKELHPCRFPALAPPTYETQENADVGRAGSGSAGGGKALDCRDGKR